MNNLYLILEDNSHLINIKSHAIIKKFYSHISVSYYIKFNNEYY